MVGDGSMLVYFVASADFSHPPANLSAKDVTVTDGAVLEVVPTNPCTEFLLKGYVRQDIAWLQNFTVVNITIAAGAVQDCSGRDFPGAEVSAYIQNGPIGSMYVPNMAVTSGGPVTSNPSNFISIAFSEPIFGLTISAFNITLAQTNTAPLAPAPSPLLTPVLAPAPSSASSEPACVPGYNITAEPVVANSTQFYDVLIDLPDCYFGVVDVAWSGSVTAGDAAPSLPIKPVSFARVLPDLIQVPAFYSGSYSALPPLGNASSCS